MLFKKEWLMFTELSEIVNINVLTGQPYIYTVCIYIYIYIYVMPFNMELLFQLRELFIKYSILLDWSNINI